MVATRAVGAAAFAGAALLGGALGWAAERRLTSGGRRLELDEEWAELHRTLPGSSTFVESFDCTRLHVRLGGPPDGPTIVFAHGYGLAHTAWHHQRRDLAERYRVVAYDQRGHAGSDAAASGDYTVQALGRDLDAVLRAVAGPGPVLLVGHSMGGMSVLSWAGRTGDAVADRVAGAVIADSTGSDVLAGGIASSGIAALAVLQSRLVTRAFATAGRTARITDRVAHSDVSWLFTKALGLSSDAHPAHVAFTEELLVSCPNSVRAALVPMLTGLDLRKSAPALAVPTLVLCGERDRLTPPSQSQKLVDALPDAEYREVPGAGHMAPLEAHEAVTGHVADWAAKTLADARPRAGRG